MRIVIDLQGAQSESRFRGIGRYSLSLTQALIRKGTGHEFVVALNGMFPETIEPIRSALDGLLPQEDIRVWYAPGPVIGMSQENAPRIQVAELMREAFLNAQEPDLILVTSLFDGFGDDTVTSIGELPARHKVVSMIYDLIPLVQSEVYLTPNPAYEKFYRQKLQQLRRADAWLTISECSRREAVDLLGLDEDRIANISGACDPVFARVEVPDADIASFEERFGIGGPFVLYSGGADARKNLFRLISSYSQLPASLRNAHQLVIAGKMPAPNVSALRAHAKACGLAHQRLIFTGSVTDKELCHLYNLCRAYVFPSLHEGFGLPVLEAMSCGAPVIAAGTSSLPEVVGIPEALFDPTDEQDIVAKLVRVLSDDEFRRTLVEHGLAHVGSFSWDACADKALEALGALCGADEQVATPAAGFPADSGEAAAQEASRLIRVIGPLSSGRDDDATMRLAMMIALNHPLPRRKKVFVDISELARHDAATGVQRVTRSILSQLLRSPPQGYDVELVYGTTDKPGYFVARKFIAKLGNLTSDEADEVIETMPGDIFLGLDLQHQVTRYQSPYLSALRARGVAVYFVVYDLLPIQFPQFWPTALGNAHAEWLQILARYDGAICISQAVARELIAWRNEHVSKPSRPYRIGWFHLGADIDNSVPSRGMPDDGERVLGHLQSRPTFLSVGTIEPRKSHHVTVEAFEHLWASGQDVNLVLVGKQGWLVDDLIAKLQTHPRRGTQLFWLSGVSDEYLARIYQSADCLVTASVGEGFGLPLIEAAQHNIPIIARDLPVFREVAGDHATYFSGGADALATTINHWLALDRDGRTPAVSGMQWLTWDQSTEQLKRVIFGGEWMDDATP